MADTFRDGVQMERCLFCGSAVRQLNNAPVVTLPLSLVEMLAWYLNGQHPQPGCAMDSWLKQLEHAAGRTVKQMLESAEAVPAHIKTDRSGLEVED